MLQSLAGPVKFMSCHVSGDPGLEAGELVILSGFWVSGEVLVESMGPAEYEVKLRSRASL